jgi:hypothetical protein
MKRNMDLARQILLQVEAHPKGWAPHVRSAGKCDGHELLHHVYLLGEAGFLRVSKITNNDSDGPEAIPICLTWEGHEFLANTADENRWEKVKKAAGTVGWDVIGKVAAGLALSSAKSALGIKE